MRRLLPCLAVLVLTAPTARSAGDARYELGQRLRAFERAYETHNDPAARERVVPFLKKATPLFFFGQLSEAARQLDLARMALESDKEPDATRRWAESLVFRPEARLFDASTEAVPFTLDSFYEVASAMPEQMRVRLTWCTADGKPLDGESATELDVKALPLKDKALRKNPTSGDYLWRCEVLVGDRVLARWEQTLSFASRLDGRLDKLRKAVGDPADNQANTDRQTARMLADLLTRLRNKETLETNYPAARLLDEAEAAADGKPSYGRGRPGQFWLKLGLEKGPSFVRLLAPEAAAKGRPLPLVIALHGAGGSENMFFDGYGDGAIVKLCERRGWLLVAPRGGLAPGLIDEIDRLYPVDRKRVFLIGHSMGASQAAAAASRSPETFAAVAALSGGGPARPSDALKAVPFFVAAGAEDLGLIGSRGLRDDLQRAGVKKLVYRELPDVEHLLSVQASLQDVFAFFDESAKE